MSTINEAILDGNIRHAHWLERYKASTVRKIITALNKADKNLADLIAARLARIEERGYDLSKEETERLKKLLDEIRAQRTQTYALLYDETRFELREFAIHEADFQKRLIEVAAEAAAVSVEMNRPALSQLRAAVTAKPFQGVLLRDWFSRLGEDSGRKITAAIQNGIIEGQTTDQIVRRIRGTRALKYSDGFLEVSRRDAASIVRTAVAHVSTVASEELYAANDDIVQGVQWVSTLDSRTTTLCASRDGNMYGIGKGPRPPAHFNCRSTTVPYLGPDINGRGTRSSAAGPVPRTTTYQDWLKRQPASVQNEILGVGKAKLFRDGGVTLDRFVDATGKEYTLQQLRALEAR